MGDLVTDGDTSPKCTVASNSTCGLCRVVAPFPMERACIRWGGGIAGSCAHGGGPRSLISLDTSVKASGIKKKRPWFRQYSIDPELRKGKSAWTDTPKQNKRQKSVSDPRSCSGRGLLAVRFLTFIVCDGVLVWVTLQLDETSPALGGKQWTGCHLKLTQHAPD